MLHAGGDVVHHLGQAFGPARSFAVFSDLGIALTGLSEHLIDGVVIDRGVFTHHFSAFFEGVHTVAGGLFVAPLEMVADGRGRLGDVGGGTESVLLQGF